MAGSEAPASAKAAGKQLPPIAYCNRASRRLYKLNGIPEHVMAVDFWILSLMAEQGDAAAQYYFGLMYKGTRAVPQDMAEALKWVRKAAEQGYAEAQCHLGLMHGLGKGVSQDYVQAYIWFSAAAAQGNIKAKTFRNLIAKLLKN